MNVLLLVSALEACSGDHDDTPPPPPAPQTAPSTSAAPAIPAPTSAFSPLNAGAEVLANYRGQGWFYAAVVTGQRGADQVEVVYADGDVEVLAAGGLLPDQLGPGVAGEARRRQTPFGTGTIVARQGAAVLFHFADESQYWTSISRVRVQVGQGALAIGSRPSTPTAELDAVLANYRQQGAYYPARVLRREGGRAWLIYADGDNEWLPEGQLRPDTLQAGAAVEFMLHGNRTVQSGSVVRRVGHAVEIRMMGGRKVWAALATLRVR